ncbi:MAG: hypothetical protein IIC74_05785 [Bacteroidetes bacterium]|nr:hypothetical protein [Bacteroidota bacterium]
MSTSDNINYTITGYYLPSTGLKFRENNDWTNNWGGDNFPVGTTTANDIPVTSNYYDIAFNINTGDYSFSHLDHLIKILVLLEMDILIGIQIWL